MARTGSVLVWVGVCILLYAAPAIAAQYSSFDDELTSMPDVLEEKNARAVFSRWMAHHDKQYCCEKEEERRFINFWDNMQHVHAHNMQTSISFKMGINHMADLTVEEASEQLGGLVLPTQVLTAAAAEVPPGHIAGEDVDSSCGFTAANRNVSGAVDWRSILPPVKNQGACGSCWAYSTTAAVEAVTAIMTGERLVLSEQELTDCNWQSSHCDGGNIEEGFKWVVANGLGSIEDYPYNNADHTNLTCDTTKAFRHRATVDGYEMVPRGEASLRHALTVSPVSVGIDAFQKDFMNYKSGVYDGMCKNGIEDLGHAVLAVGYGTEELTGTPYFIIRNSWTAEWGEGGYIRIKAAVGGQGDPVAGHCGIALLGTRPIKDGSVQFHVNGTWPEWAKKLDPSKHDVTPSGPGPVNPDDPPPASFR